MTFPPGKLPLDVLDRLLNRYTGTEERIIVGARVGEDADRRGDLGGHLVLV